MFSQMLPFAEADESALCGSLGVYELPAEATSDDVEPREENNGPPRSRDVVLAAVRGLHFIHLLVYLFILTFMPYVCNALQFR